MTNEYYTATADKIPIATIRSNARNTDAAAVESGFDKIPTLQNMFRIQYGADVSTLATLIEVTVTTLAGAYFEGMQIFFEAAFSSTGATQIAVNGGSNVPLLDGFGAALAADQIQAGQIITVVKLPGAESTGFQLTSTLLTQLDIAVAAAAAASATASAAAAAASADELAGNRALTFFLGAR